MIGEKFKAITLWDGVNPPKAFKRRFLYLDTDSAIGRFSQRELDKLSGVAEQVSLRDDRPIPHPPVQPPRRVHGKQSALEVMLAENGEGAAAASFGATDDSLAVVGVHEHWITLMPCPGEVLGQEVGAPAAAQVLLARDGKYGLYAGAGGEAGLAKCVAKADTDRQVRGFIDYIKGAIQVYTGEDDEEHPTPRDAEDMKLDKMTNAKTTAVQQAIVAVGRAQRSVHPKSSADKQLKEQLDGLRGSCSDLDEAVNTFFTDSGAAKTSYADMMAKLKVLLSQSDAGAADLAAEVDARVLPILRSNLGIRHRSFKEAVDQMTASAWSDWPLAGRRTSLFVLSFIGERYSTPEQRHARFNAEG